MKVTWESPSAGLAHALVEEPDEAGGRGARRRRLLVAAAVAGLLMGVLFVHLAMPAPALASASAPISWGSAHSIDTLVPYTEPNSFRAMSCASGSLCVGDTAFGDIVSSSDPTGTSSSAWSVLPSSLLSSGATGYGLAAVSCASGFCATGGENPNAGDDGVILTSTNPAGGSASDWSHASVSDTWPIQFIQCQSGSSCIAVDADGYVLSYDGTAWTKSGTPLIGAGEYNLTGLSCPSSGLCVASDYGGDVYISDGPSDLTTPWSEQTSTTTGVPDASAGVSCSSSSDCALLSTSGGEAAYTTDASNATPSWTVGTASSALQNSISLTCVNGSSTCLAGVSGGRLYASTDGGSSFAQAAGFPAGAGNPGPIGCAGSSLCVAGTEQGDVSASTDPTAGVSSTWTGGLLAANGLDSVQFGPSSCPSGTLCVGADSQGRLFTGRPGTFTERTLTNAAGLGAPVCPASSLCVDTNGDSVFSSTDPSSGGSSWRESASDPSGGQYIEDLQCPSTTLCVGYTDNGDVINSTSPSGSSWNRSSHTVQNANYSVSGLTCPSASLCVGFASDYASDTGSYMFASRTPDQVNSGWSASSSPVDSDNFLNGLTCASSSLCVAFDYAGHVLTSTNPAAGAWSAPVTVDGANAIIDLTCPSSKLCVGYDSRGHLLTSTDPTGGASAWSVSGSAIDANAIDRIVCPTTSLCLLSDAKGHVLESDDPAGGASTWQTVGLDTGHNLLSLTCSGTALCLAADDAGRVFEGTPVSPTGSGVAARAKVKGTKVIDRLSCHGTGGQKCTFAMALTVVETLRHGKVVAVSASARHRKTVRVGAKKVTLAAGRSVKETLDLNHAGRALLRKRHKLPASFTVTQGTHRLRHQTVRFRSR